MTEKCKVLETYISFQTPRVTGTILYRGSDSSFFSVDLKRENYPESKRRHPIINVDNRQNIQASVSSSLHIVCCRATIALKTLAERATLEADGGLIL